MAKIKTIGFRPEEDDASAILLAERATGFKRSELVRRCVRRSLEDVVRGILSTHEQAVREFELALQESPSYAGPAPSTKPVNYVSRKPKGKVA
jgi:hypothetical protein